MPEEVVTRQHSPTRSFVLHVAPAAVAFTTYLWIFLPAVTAWGLPPRVAGLMMGSLILTPLLLGPLLYSGWRQNGQVSLDGVVLYREQLPLTKLAVLVGALLAWAVLVVALVSGVDQWLLENVFHAYPAQPDNDIAGHPAVVRIATRVGSLFIVGLIVPVAEELYFRGYLLPRVEWMGTWAVPWTAVLFTLQHFHSPWQSATRILLLLPMIFVVQRTRSVGVGIAVHVIANTIGELLMLSAAVQGR